MIPDAIVFSKSENQQRVKRIGLFLVFAVIQGLFPVVEYFHAPSMERNAFLFGYSRSRILIGGSFILLLVLLAGFALLFIFSSPVRAKILRLIDRWLNQDRLLVTVVVAAGSVLSVFILFWAVGLETTIDLNTFEVIFSRLRWMITWFAVISAQFFTFLLINYRPQFSKPGFFNKTRILSVVLMLLMVDLSLFHWIILEYEIQVFASLPYWTWFIQRKEANLAVAGLLFFMSLIITLLILWKSNWKKTSILLLIALGYILQLGYGFVEGRGIQSIQKKTTNAGHVWYLEHAVDNLDLSAAVFHYEEAFGSNVYLGTKPPGVLIYYLIHQRISNSVSYVHGYQARFDRLLDYITYLFPLFTFLAIIPLFVFSQKYLPAQNSLFAAILFLFLPNIILMPMELDQVLFPTLFLLGLILIQRTIEKRSLIWGLITGMFLYTAVFFTFSLIPLVLLTFTWIAIDYWVHRKERNIFELLKLGGAIGFGFAFLFLIGYFLLQYDPLLRYQNAMKIHRTLKEFQPGFGQILSAIRMNNLEIASWIGFPIAVLSISRVLRSIRNFILNSTSAMDILSFSSALVYVVLNLVGQTRGEVGRLWIFMTPLFVTFTTYEIVHFFRHKKTTIIFLVIIQFMTTLMIFRCQDFW